MVRDDQVDFSFLPIEAQEGLLRSIGAGEGKELESYRRQNTDTLEKIGNLLETVMAEPWNGGDSKTAALDRRFGRAAYANGFQRIVESFAFRTQKPDGASPPGIDGIWEQVQRAFLKLENLRLLYDY